jgi:DDE superfamily endonuclease
VTPTQLRRIRTRLITFAENLFEPMPRKDQRRWGQSYLRGLLLDGKRKSIQPMAARLARGDPQADADALEQFCNQSPWDPVPVRRRLAQRMTTTIGPAAWVIDDTGFPKFGRHLVAVAPQDCGALGKVANCQVGVSVHAATDQASCPLDWRLFLPQSWESDAERRRKAHVPQGERHRPKWQLALEMLDELAAWDLAAPVILADAADGEVNGFRLGLEQRELADVVQVPATISAYPQQVAPRDAAVCRPGAAIQAALPPATLVAAAVGGGRGPGGGPHPHLAPRRRPAAAGLAVCRPAGAPGRGPVAPGGPRWAAAGALAAGRVAPGRGRAGHLLAGQPARRGRAAAGWFTWPSCAGGWSTMIAS